MSSSSATGATEEGGELARDKIGRARHARPRKLRAVKLTMLETRRCLPGVQWNIDLNVGNICHVFKSQDWKGHA
jgi:hypothetical protein